MATRTDFNAKTNWNMAFVTVDKRVAMETRTHDVHVKIDWNMALVRL